MWAFWGQNFTNPPGIIEIDPSQLEKPIVNVMVTDDAASEDGNAGQIVITRVGDLSQDLTVNYSLGGDATNGVDYTELTGSVVIPAGQVLVTVPIHALHDAVLKEGTETLELQLTAGDYDLGTYQTGQVKISDSEQGWLREWGNDNHQTAMGVTVDADGNTYVVGRTEGSLEPGYTNPGYNGRPWEGAYDPFITKYDAQGQEIWTKQLGVAGLDAYGDVVVDSDGNIFALGHGNSETSPGNGDHKLAKWDRDGNLIWDKFIGTSAHEIAHGLQLDPEGNVVIAGWTWGELGGTNQGATDFFVGKYDTDGNELWLQQEGTPGLDWGREIAIDSDGSIYLAGLTEGTVGDENLGGFDLFVVKYDSNGDRVWSQQLGTAAEEGSLAINQQDKAYLRNVSIDLDGDGNLYLGGSTAGAVEGATNQGKMDALLYKLDGTGETLWAKQFGGVGTEMVTALKVDAAGDVYLTGTTDGDLGGQTNPDHASFIAKFNGSGDELWTTLLGTAEKYSAWDLAIDGQGNIYATGNTQGDNTGSDRDLWLAKFAAKPTVELGNLNLYTNPETGSQYFLTTPDTWLGAQEQAKAAGGNLVTINDANENQWLVDTFGTTIRWIGATDSEIYGGTEGEFQWVSGETFSYSGWSPGNPDNASVPNGEDFAYTNFYAQNTPGMWNDSHHEIGITGIVEIPGTPTTVTLEALDNQASEDGNAAMFAVRLDQVHNQDITVNYTLADPNGDLAPQTGSVVVKAGEQFATFGVNAIHDYAAEGTESITVSLAEGSYALGDTTEQTVEIADSTETFRYGPFVHEYGGKQYLLSQPDSWHGAQAQAQALGGNLVAINDQAEQDWLLDNFGSDVRWIGLTDSETYGATEGDFQWVNGDALTYTNWTPGEPNNNPGPDGEEDFTEIYATGGWNDLFARDPATVDTNRQPQRGIIEIDPTQLDKPIVNVMVTDAEAGEDGNAGQIVFTRVGALSQDLTVNYSLGGDATNGVDYAELSGQVTIAAGETFVKLPILGLYDGEFLEANETLELSLAAGDYDIGLHGTGQVTINNEEPSFQPEWVQQWGTEGSDRAAGLTSDSLGNVYVVGVTYGDLDGNTNATTDKLWADPFITKYNAAGEKQWTRQLGTTGFDYYTEVAADAQGNLYALGYGDGVGTTGQGDLKLAKWDSDGNLVWDKFIGTPNHELAFGLKVAPDGNLVISGWVEEGQIGSPADFFVGKYDPDGEEVWFKQDGTAASDRARDVAIDADGNIYVAGMTEGDLAGQNAGGSDIFVAKYDADGQQLWVQQLGTAADDGPGRYGYRNVSVDVDATGQVYVATESQGVLPGHEQQGSHDALLFKLEPTDGTTVWAQQFGTPGLDQVDGIKTDPDGNVYLSGWTNNNEPQLKHRAFLAKFDSAGQELWTNIYGTGVSEEIALDLEVDGSGNVYTAGHTWGDFGGENAGERDIFLAKFPATPVSAEPKIYTNPETGSQYFLTTPDTWLGAQAQAEAAGGDLVAINTATENQWLLETFGPEQLWIGLTDSELYGGTEGAFQWVNGDTASYQNWSPNHPDNSDILGIEGEDFAHLYDDGQTAGQWNDLAHSHIRPGIVEIPGTPTTVTLEALDNQASEDGNAAMFAVKLSQVHDQDITVNYTLEDSNGDLAPQTGSVVVQAGEQFATFGLSAIHDYTAEGTESVVVKLAAGGYALGDTTEQTVEIADSTTTSRYGPFVYSNPETGNLYLVSETDTWHGAQAQAQALGGNLVSINDQAEEQWLMDTFGAVDYRSWWIGLTDSEAYGATEGNFQWVNSDPLSHTHWGSGAPNNLDAHPDGEDFVAMNLGRNFEGGRPHWNDLPADYLEINGAKSDVSRRGIIEIDPTQLDKPIVNVMVTDGSAGEDGNAGQIVFTRVGDLSQDLTVNYSLGGDATNGVDYAELSGQVTIAAGEALAKLPVLGLYDGVFLEGQETLELSLAAGDYEIGLHSTGQVKINGDNPNFQPEWVQQWGTKGSDHALGLTSDSTGNVYVVGVTNTIGAPSPASFITKYSVSGEKEWSRKPGLTSFDYYTEVAADDQGKIYALGYSHGIGTHGQGDLQLAKWDSDGNLIWNKFIGTPKHESAFGLKLAPDGNIVISGFVTVGIGSPADFFVGKYDPDGVEIWFHQDGTTADERARDVALDVDGNIYIAGRTEGTLAGQNTDESDIFVSKYSPDGQQIWVQQLGTTATDGSGRYGSRNISIDVDKAGQVYVATESQGALSGHESNGGSDAILFKLHTNGETIWTQQFGGQGHEHVDGIKTDQDGNFYLSGWTDGSIDNQQNLGHNTFLAKFDSTGNKLWTNIYGSEDSKEIAWDIEVDNHGNVYSAGYTTGNFGNESAGEHDIFLTKFSATTTVIDPKIYTSPVTGSQYFLTSPDTWLGAQEQAEAAGGNLAAINDAAEQAWLQNVFGSNGQQEWIGLTDSPIYGQSGGQYQWVNGEAATYTNWYLTEPNNKIWTPEGEDFSVFGHTGSGEWNDLPSNPDWIRQGIVEIPGTPNNQPTLQVTPVQQWVRQLGSTSYDLSEDVAVDADGNVFLTGYIKEDLGEHEYQGPENPPGDAGDAFLAKYTNDGELLWTQTLGSAGQDTFRSVVTDAEGNAYVAGSTTDALDGQTSSGSGDGFFAKYDADGQLLWSRQVGTSSHDRFFSLVTDGAGSFYTVGATGGLMDGDSTHGGYDALVMKWDSDGNQVWTRQLTSTASSFSHGHDAVVDSATGDIIIAGYVYGTLDGETAAGKEDLMVTRYNSEGEKLWQQQFGTPETDVVDAVALDSEGNIYISGVTEGALEGEASGGDRDVVVAKLDPQGNVIWTDQFAGTGGSSTGSDHAYGIGVDANDQVFVTGHIDGSLDDNNYAGTRDAFLASYDTDGNRGNSQQFGFPSWDSLYHVDFDGENNLFIAGAVAGAMPGQTHTGWLDPIVAKYNFTQTYLSNTALDLTGIAAHDLDADTVTVSLTLSDAAAGTLSSAVSNGATVAFADGVLTVEGSAAELNAVLDAVQFTPAADYDQTVTIQTSVTDGVSDPVLGNPITLEHNGATFLSPDAAYLSFHDSPFKTESFSTFHLENFEDGALNTPGVSLSTGMMISPDNNTATDSVDGDDGAIDGSGLSGTSWYAPGARELTVSFDAQELGALPTHAGLAMTDIARLDASGQHIGDVQLEAFDAAGNSLGKTIIKNFGDNVSGGTDEDRFLGVQYDQGISSLKITLPDGNPGLEIDHIQYGIAGEPPASYDWTWTHFGEDLHTEGNDVRLENRPNSNTARAEFLGNLENVATVDFENLTPGQAATTLNFGDTQATLTGFTHIHNQPTETNGGMFPISGDQFLGSYNDTTLKIAFDSPQTAFGFTATDAEGTPVTLILHHTDGTTQELNIPVQGVWPANTGSALFYGVTELDSPFDAVTFTRPAGTERIGLDDLVIGTVKPEVRLATTTPPNSTLHLAYHEDQPLDLSNIVVRDRDGEATVKLTLSDPNAGGLSVATAGNVTADYDAATGVWTATGDVADVNTLLADLIFTPAQDSTAAVSIATEFTVGTGAPLTGTVQLTGIETNDALAIYIDPVQQWTQQFGTSESDQAVDVTRDNAGNLIVLGETRGQLGDTHAGGQDAFLAKYDQDGKQLWLTQFGDTDYEWMREVVSDPDGNLIVAGSTGTQSWDRHTLIAKFDANGNELWQQTFANTDEDAAFNLATDATGNIYVTGQAKGSLNGQISAGLHDAYIVKLDGDGNELWTQQFGTAGKDAIDGISIAPDGSLYVGGTTWDDPNGNVEVRNGFIRKYDADGNAIWRQDFGTAQDDLLQELRTDAAGNVYVAGVTTGDLAGTHQGGWDAFVIKYDATGNQVWAQQFGTAGDDGGAYYRNGLGIDSEGNVYFAGGTTGDLAGSNAGSHDPFIVRFDEAGQLTWETQLGTNRSDSLTSLVLNPDDSVVLAGWTQGDLAGAGQGGNDAVLTKYDYRQTYQANTVLELTGIAIAEPDAGDTVTVQLTLSDAAAGMLSSPVSNGATVAFAAGVLTVEGTAADVNAVLDAVQFTPAADYAQTVEIQTTVTDGESATVTGQTLTLAAEAVGGYDWTWTHFGEDIHTSGSNDVRLADTPNSDTARAEFLGNLENIATVDFENFTPGGQATTLNFGDTQATVTGFARIYNVPTETVSGMFPTSGDQFLGNFNDERLKIEFDNPQTAFGFTATDTENTPLTLTLHHTDGTTSELNIPAQAKSSVNTGSALFYGVTDLDSPFDAVTLNRPNRDERIGLDDLVIGTVKPEVRLATTTPPNSTLHLAYHEDQPLDLSNIVVRDRDGEATVKLTLSDPNAGELSVATAGNVTANYDAATGVWTATGDVAEINTLLADLVFTPARDSVAAVSIATEFTVGTGAPLTGTVQLTGIETNDAPTIAVTPETLEFTRQFGSPGWDGANDVLVDGDGNSYVIGYAKGDIDGQTNAGSTPEDSSQGDGLIIKYDAEGNKVWTKLFGDSAGQRLEGGVVGSDGGIYVVGVTSGSDAATNAGGNDALLVKYDADGSVVWQRQLGTATDEMFNAVVSDGSGYLYTVGYTAGILGDDTTTSAAGYDTVLSKWNGDGDRVWTKQLSDWPSSTGSSLAYDAATNSLVLGGSVYGALPDQTHGGQEDALVASFDLDGNLRWSQQFGNGDNNGISKIAVDDQGNIAILGSTFGSLPGQSSAGSRDIFVAKYDAQGKQLWPNQFGGPSDDYGISGAIAFDAQGNILFSATQTGATTDIDAVLGAFDGQGNRLDWTETIASPEWDSMGAIAFDKTQDNLHVIARTSSSVNGEPTFGSLDGVLLKYSINSTYQANTPLEISNIQVNDQDAGDVLTVQLTLSDAAAGTLSSTVSNGATVAFAAGVLTVEGTAAEVNAILDGVQFTPATNYTETVKIQSTVTDGVSAPVSGATITLEGNTAPTIAVTPETLEFTRQFGTSTWDGALDSAVDSVGNTYIIGFTNGDLDGQTNQGNNKESGHGDGFVVKYDAEGNKLWTRLLGGPAGERFRGVKIGQDGGIYITGSTFSSLEGNNQGGKDAIFLKYSPEGDQLWLHQLGTAEEEILADVVTDSDGYLYTVGYTQGSLADDPVTPNYGYDTLLIKWDQDGNRLWTKQVSDWPNNLGTELIFNAETNSLYIGGVIGGELPGQTRVGKNDAYLANFDLDGNLIWGTQFGSTETEGVSAIALDSQGNIALLGNTHGSLPGQTSAGDSDVFVAKYNNWGEQLWTYQAGGAEYDYASYDSIQFDASGNVVFTMVQRNGDVQNFDGILTMLDANGQPVPWREDLDYPGWDQMAMVHFDENQENLYVVGRSHSSVNGQPYAGSLDSVLFKYSYRQTYQAGTPIAIANIHVNDVDTDDTLTVQLTLSDAAAGTLTSSITNNATSEFTDGVLTVKGSTAEVNAILDDLTFNPSPNYLGTVKINSTVTDGQSNPVSGATITLEGNAAPTLQVEPTRQWLRQLGSSGYDISNSIAIDAQENVYVVGFVQGEVDGQPYAGSSGLPGGFGDGILTKYTAEGEKVWTRTIGTAADENSYGVAIGSDGSVFVTGGTGAALPGKTHLGKGDGFLVKYNAETGEQGWLRQFGTSDYDNLHSITSDGQGHLYTVGSTAGLLDGTTTHYGGDALVIKWDEAGNQLWTRQITSQEWSTSEARHVVHDPVTGDIVLTGYVGGTLDGETSLGSYDVLVARYSSDGELRWHQQLGTAAQDDGYITNIDSDGNIYVGGYTYGTLPGETSAGDRDAFLSKLDGAGNVLWSRQFGTAGSDGIGGIHFGPGGQVYVSGGVTGSFAGHPDAGTIDALIAGFDTDGNAAWSQQFGTPGWDGLGQIVANDADAFYSTVRSSGEIDGQPHAGGQDLGVAKYGFKQTYQANTVLELNDITVNDRNPDDTLTVQLTLSDAAAGTLSSPVSNNATIEFADGILTVEGSAAEVNAVLDAVQFTPAIGYTQTVQIQTSVTDGESAAVAGATLTLEGNNAPSLQVAPNREWVRQMGYTGKNSDITTDSQGNIYSVGSARTDLNGQAHTDPHAQDDAQITKHDAQGNLLWTRLLGTLNKDYFMGVAVDADGNVGVIGNQVDEQTDPAKVSGLFAKYDAAGNLIQELAFDPGFIGEFRKAAVDADGNFYAAGYAIENSVGRSLLVKINQNGEVVWSKQLDPTTSQIIDIAYDATNQRLYTTGASHGGTRLSLYDLEGNVIWDQSISPDNTNSLHQEAGYEIAVDDQGNAYIAGETLGSYDGEINQGNKDIFVAKYNSQGEQLWAQQFGTSGWDFGRGIAVDRHGHVFVSGQFEESIAVATERYGADSVNQQLADHGRIINWDAVLKVFDTNGNEIPWQDNLYGDSWDHLNQMTWDEEGNLYASGNNRTVYQNANIILKYNYTQTYRPDTTLDLDPIYVQDADAGDTLTVTLTLADAAAGTLSSTVVNDATTSFENGVMTLEGSAADLNAILGRLSFTPEAGYKGTMEIATTVLDTRSLAPIQGNTIKLEANPTALLDADAIAANHVAWIDWQGGANTETGFGAEGAIVTTHGIIDVTFSGDQHPRMVQYGDPEDVDHWGNGSRGSEGRDPANSPYTSATVGNIPTASEMIALREAGSQSLTFSETVVNPFLAFNSLNGGNRYVFDQDFTVLSFGDATDGNAAGHDGSGTATKEVVDLGNGQFEYHLTTTGYGHGTIQFHGALDQINWRSTQDDHDNGFTVGLLGDQTPNVAPSLSGVDGFAGATQYQAQTISYAELLAASDAFDADGDELGFRIEGVGDGVLTLNGEAIAVGQTLVRPGDELQWASNLAGDAVLGFQVSAVDALGAASERVDVAFDITSAFPAQLNLSDLDGNNGFSISGGNAEDYLGFAVSNAGDVNGDGIDDFLVSAPLADPNGTGNAGVTHVVFGDAAIGSASTFDISTLNGTNGFTINGIGLFDNSGFAVSNAGDINDDGTDDLLIGGYLADPAGKPNAGASYVVFGGAIVGSSGSLELADLDGTDGFTINGIDANDHAGVSVSNAGDINGDGVDDVLLGAYYAAPDGKSHAGESYVVFGGSTVGSAGSLELADLNGPNGFVIKGANFGDLSGVSVSNAGDVNGDNVDDLLIDAHYADANGQFDAGAGYVVFGGATVGSSGGLGLADLNGTNGFAINGIDPLDYSGYALSNAGDVNGDGFDDVLIGARQADPDGKFDAGESYVVFGGDTVGNTGSLDLADLDGSDGFAIKGIAAGDQSGFEVSNAGDINADGFDDLLIGAHQADANGNPDAGETYVVFGGQDVGSTGSLELASLDGSNGFVLKGTAAGDRSGRGLSNAGDVNGDGVDDVLIGAHHTDANGQFDAGAAYVVFGEQNSLLNQSTYYRPSTPYTTPTDSPFQTANLPTLHIEDFQDNLINQSNDALTIQNHTNTDIITGGITQEDNLLNGNRALQVNSTELTLDFAQDFSHVGLVITDIDPGSTVTIQALDRQGNSLGQSDAHTFSNAADEFLGISNNKGIASVKIATNDTNGWQVDHIQYG